MVMKSRGLEPVFDTKLFGRHIYKFYDDLLVTGILFRDLHPDPWIREIRIQIPRFGFKKNIQLEPVFDTKLFGRHI